jgi:hypothetical protein
VAAPDGPSGFGAGAVRVVQETAVKKKRKRSRQTIRFFIGGLRSRKNRKQAEEDPPPVCVNDVLILPILTKSGAVRDDTLTNVVADRF